MCPPAVPCVQDAFDSTTWTCRHFKEQHDGSRAVGTRRRQAGKHKQAGAQTPQPSCMCSMEWASTMPHGPCVRHTMGQRQQTINCRCTANTGHFVETEHVYSSGSSTTHTMSDSDSHQMTPGASPVVCIQCNDSHPINHHRCVQLQRADSGGPQVPFSCQQLGPARHSTNSATQRLHVSQRDTCLATLSKARYRKTGQATMLRLPFASAQQGLALSLLYARRKSHPTVGMRSGELPSCWFGLAVTHETGEHQMVPAVKRLMRPTVWSLWQWVRKYCWHWGLVKAKPSTMNLVPAGTAQTSTAFTQQPLGCGPADKL
jgi:hypothetical protein